MVLVSLDMSYMHDWEGKAFFPENRPGIIWRQEKPLCSVTGQSLKGKLKRMFAVKTLKTAFSDEKRKQVLPFIFIKT